MNTLGSRIAHYRHLAGLSQAALAKACGWSSQSRVGNYEKDAREPSLADIDLLAKALGINAEQLTSASAGPAQVQPTGTPSEEDYALIPQYTAKGACGDGYLNDHVEIRGGLAFKRDWLKRMGAKPEHLFVIYADGDSMEPFIFEGDVVLFDSADCEPQDRQVYAFRRPAGGISIKRLSRQLSGAWMIRSDNQDKARHPDEQVSDDAMHDMPILGRVIWRGGAM